MIEKKEYENLRKDIVADLLEIGTWDDEEGYEFSETSARDIFRNIAKPIVEKKIEEKIKSYIDKIIENIFNKNNSQIEEFIKDALPVILYDTLQTSAYNNINILLSRTKDECRNQTINQLRDMIKF